MAYTPQTWVNGEPGGTPLSAERLNNIEAGIEDADTRLTTAEADIAGKADAAAPAAAVSDHVEAANPHAQYLQQADADNRYILGSIAPTFANADATTAALDTKADQATVDALGVADLADFNGAGAAVGDLLAVSQVTSGAATGFTRVTAPMNPIAAAIIFGG